jgi:hypothetical protein
MSHGVEMSNLFKVSDTCVPSVLSRRNWSEGGSFAKGGHLRALRLVSP